MPDTFSTGLTPLDVAQPASGGGACLALFGSWHPHASQTLPLAERVRAALMRASAGCVPAQISGKTEAGTPRVGHDHLYILPIEQQRGCGLDRVLLWARDGLEADTREVLERLAERGGDIGFRGRPRLRVEVLSLGGRELLESAWTRSVFGPSRTWRSCSSFVAPRFPKRRRGELLDAPVEQLQRLLGLVHGLEMPEVRELEGGWSACEQRRMTRENEPRRVASGWELRFSRPVAGPLVLGYGAHFGLGRFEVCSLNGREDS